MRTTPGIYPYARELLLAAKRVGKLDDAAIAALCGVSLTTLARWSHEGRAHTKSVQPLIQQFEQHAQFERPASVVATRLIRHYHEGSRGPYMVAQTTMAQLFGRSPLQWTVRKRRLLEALTEELAGAGYVIITDPIIDLKQHTVYPIVAVKDLLDLPLVAADSIK